MGVHEASRDKRSTPRYPTRGAQAGLWWKVGDDYQSLAVRLADISMGGVAALAAAVPPVVSPLWIGVPGTPVEDWVEATLVEVRRNRILFVPRRGYVLRMKFTNGCTFDLFKNAIRGFAREFSSEVSAPDDVTWFNRQSWR